MKNVLSPTLKVPTVLDSLSTASLPKIPAEMQGNFFSVTALYSEKEIVHFQHTMEYNTHSHS